ncbi:MAG: hypothetical protein K0R57_992 [Paenibacillaceae bacterium]|jgi:uncharacterized RDD family membrane protein YckC|nr:hypothetical protein [Paenibacillaceae bacterium]
MQHHIEREELSVVTPEQVRLRFLTAGVGSRAGAHAVDLLLLILFYSLLFVLIGEFTVRSSGWGMVQDASEYMIAGAIILVLAIQLGYFVICECMMGKTVGQRIVGLRVIQDNGRPVTVLSSILRNLLRVVDFLPSFYLVGLVVGFLHPKGKRVGDLLAGTVVIYDNRNGQQEKKSQVMRTIGEEGWNISGFRLEDRHRRLVSRQDWLALEALIERRNELTEESLAKLSAELADYFRQRLEISAEEAGRVTQTTFLVTIYTQLREDWQLTLTQ